MKKYIITNMNELEEFISNLGDGCLYINEEGIRRTAEEIKRNWCGPEFFGEWLESGLHYVYALHNPNNENANLHGLTFFGVADLKKDAFEESLLILEENKKEARLNGDEVFDFIADKQKFELSLIEGECQEDATSWEIAAYAVPDDIYQLISSGDDLELGLIENEIVRINRGER